MAEPLVLKSLYVRRFGSSPLIAAIEFSSGMNEVKLELPEEATQAILSVVADMVAAASREVATALTAQVIEQANNPLITSEES